MVYSAVALAQDKRLFGSAPKDIQELIQPKTEQFKGQHFLGWVFLILSLLMVIATAVLAVWNGVRNDFDFLLLTRSHFFQKYYPEVNVCKSCHKFGFNLKS